MAFSIRVPSLLIVLRFACVYAVIMLDQGQRTTLLCVLKRFVLESWALFRLNALHEFDRSIAWNSLKMQQIKSDSKKLYGNTEIIHWFDRQSVLDLNKNHWSDTIDDRHGKYLKNNNGLHSFFFRYCCCVCVCKWTTHSSINLIRGVLWNAVI